jgi:hypothetical protein
LFDQLACTILFESCIEADGIATVVRNQARPTTRQRPCPLNTIELQKRASNFFRMGSDRTMAVAEALYQRGILSYPRTETGRGVFHSILWLGLGLKLGLRLGLELRLVLGLVLGSMVGGPISEGNYIVSAY